MDTTSPVDSKERELELSEILVRAAFSNNGAVSNVDDLSLSPQVVLAILSGEMSMRGVDTKQFGNTLFITHPGEGENRKKVVGRALNSDTGRNFMNNALQYAAYLQEKGVTHYSTEFEGTSYLNAFKVLRRLFQSIDSTVAIGRLEDEGSYRAFVLLGKDPIPAAM
tara:strand:- start:2662 stop:3159 length:498 start_codon:yes stop_codon:yes gene_type:complete